MEEIILCQPIKKLLKYCNFEECNSRASYNYENLTPGKFCSFHKLDKMIDVVSKKCEKEDCNKTASYNYDNLKTRRFCNLHKLKVS